MRIRFAALAILMLTACQEAPPAPQRQTLELNGPAYTLNVATITVAQDYKSSKRPPNVELLADISPAQAMKQWAGTRLVAAGHENSLELSITDASIVRHDLPKQKSGIEGMLTNEQTEQYTGTLAIDIKIYNPLKTLPVAHLNAKAERSVTLSKNAAPVDRERAYHNITVELMKAIEPEIDSNIRQYLGHYLM